MDCEIIGGNLESLEHNFSHFFSIGFWVSGGFSKKSRVLVGGDSEFIVETMMPDLFHVIPVIYDTVLDGIAEFEDTLLGLSLFSDISVFIHANHDVFILGSADD